MTYVGRGVESGYAFDHRTDWTYALIVHSQLKAAQIQANELYAAIHRCIQQALADQLDLR